MEETATIFGPRLFDNMCGSRLKISLDLLLPTTETIMERINDALCLFRSFPHTAAPNTRKSLLITDSPFRASEPNDDENCTVIFLLDEVVIQKETRERVIQWLEELAGHKISPKILVLSPHEVAEEIRRLFK